MPFQSTGKRVNEETGGTPSKGNGRSPSPMAPAADKSKQQTEEIYKLLREQVAERVKSFLTQQKEKTTKEIDSLANAFRETGDNLRQRNHGTFAAYANEVADRVERFSEELRHNDMDSAIQKVKRLARENPLAFMGGVFTLGVMFGHFLKGPSSEAIRTPELEHDFEGYSEEAASYERH